jgi:hypothetical protein
MATLGGTNLTMLEMAKRIGPDGMVNKAVNLLAQDNAFFGDLYVKPSNMPTANQSSIQTGLPTTSLKRFNEGTASTRSTTATITDGHAMLEARSVTDVDLLNTYGNAAEIRATEAEPFMESLGQRAEGLLWYGNVLDDVREFNGMDVRYNSTTGNIGNQVLSAGGSGSDVVSAWLVCHHPENIFMTYPKNTTAGMRHEDLGRQLVQDSTGISGSMLDAFVDKFSLSFGLVVKDYRYAGRVCNIEPEEFLGITGDQQLTDYATNALMLLHRLQDRVRGIGKPGCKPVYYVPRTVREGIRVQAIASKNANVYTMEQHLEGHQVVKLGGIEVKTVDQLTLETAIS